MSRRLGGWRLDDGLRFDYARPNDKPDCRWREKAERERILTEVARDAERALRAVEHADGLLADEAVAGAHRLHAVLGRVGELDRAAVAVVGAALNCKAPK